MGRLDQLATHLPGFAIESAVPVGSGQNNEAWLVNGRYIFRFAGHPSAAAQVQRELDVLRLVQGKVPVRTPWPKFVPMHDGSLDTAFFGYEAIPGAPLSRDVFSQIEDDATLDPIAGQLTGFLTALHQLPSPAHAVQETIEEWSGMYARTRERLFPRMSIEGRIRAAEQFEPYLAQPGRFGFEPALRHGDFGAGNILWDSHAQRVSGVIDFGSAGPGDPAVDFAAVLACYGADFYERCARFSPEMTRVWHRVDFYLGTFALQEALLGLDSNDDEALRSGLAGYV